LLYAGVLSIIDFFLCCISANSVPERGEIVTVVFTGSYIFFRICKSVPIWQVFAWIQDGRDWNLDAGYSIIDTGYLLSIICAAGGNFSTNY
jgi:hypothetical protein